MKKSDSIRLGIAQYAMTANQRDNFEKAVSLIEILAKDGAEVICLPEIYKTLYFCDIEEYDRFSWAETTDSPDFEVLKSITKKYGIYLLVPYFEWRARGIYHNSLAILGPQGEVSAHYRKNHIPDDPGYYEKFYFTPGDTGYLAFPTPKATIGTLICWDQWYPEASRITALLGADFICYPTAIGWHKDQDEKTNNRQRNAWMAIQRGHAVANGIFTIGVNRIGIEGDMKFWGSSFVFDPFGELLFQAPIDQEITKVIELDLNLIGETRVHWPFFRDRRVDTYSGITNKWLGNK